MGTIKKYHFVLYISEEQEYAIRQLFFLNKWDLHGKALSQLAAVLDAVQNDLTDDTHSVQNDDRHSVQNESALQLPVQKESLQQLPVQNDSTSLSLEDQDSLTFVKKKHAAQQLLSQNIQEIEKEAYATTSTLDKSLNSDNVSDRSAEYDVSNKSVKGRENEHNKIFLSENQIAETLTDSEIRDKSQSFKEQEKTLINENPETSSANILSTSVGDANDTSSELISPYVRDSRSIHMDPLARASEIAGIPFQQPDGSVYYTPDSLVYQRYENFYQLPVNSYQQQSLLDSVQREQQQPVLDSVETSVQSHSSGIEQLIRASAIVPPQDYAEYSQNGQGYHSSTASGIQSLENQLPVSSTGSFTASKVDSNTVSARTSVTGLGGSQSNITESESPSVIDENINISDKNLVVSKDFMAEQMKNSESNCKSNSNIARTELLLADTGKIQSSISETLHVDEEHIVNATKKDYVELNVNGSLVKIPVVTQSNKHNLEKLTIQDNTENEDVQKQMSVTKEKEKQIKQEPLISDIKLKGKFALNMEQNLRKKTASEERKRRDTKNISSENENLRQEQKISKKRNKNQTEENDKINKKRKTEKTAEDRNYSRDNLQQENKKHVKQKDEEQDNTNTAVKRKTQFISKVTKTYSTRFRTKKELLENAKKKKTDRVRKHHPKKSKSELENIYKKPFQDGKIKKSKLLKDDNITETTSTTMPKEEEKYKENNSKEDMGKNKVRNKKSKPKKLKVETQEKIRENVEDQVLNKEQNDTEILEPDHVEDETEFVEVNIVPEVIDELNDTKSSKHEKKLTKIKPRKPDNENEDISTIKCAECGNYCNKKGYCKVCRISCSYCEKSFTKCPSALKLYQTHIKKHINDPKPYPCTDCDMKFSSVWFLNRHAENKHINKSSSGPFLCEVCQKRFTTKYSLKGHLSHVHGDRKRDVLCDLCGDFFLSQGYLRQHRQYVHQEERNFTCHLCYVSVKTEVLLKRHMARHTEEKNEVCNICGRSFRVRSDLLRHMVRHDSNRRSFKCETCGKGFFEDQKLKQHVRIHTGVKPFKCNLCQYACAVKGNLTKHLKTHANRDGYLGRAYKRKSKVSKFVSQLITDPCPVQLQIEVITTDDDHIEQEMPHFERGEQELPHWDPHKHELPQFGSNKQELPYVEMTKQDLVQFDTSKEEMPSFETGKQEMPHFETGKQEVPQFETGKQELPHFEAVKQDISQFETLRDSSKQGGEHFEAVRTETEPVRVYYEAVHPSHIEAGRPYLAQQDMKDYKEMAEGDSYMNQINLAMIANNYKNVNKIDFYNI